VERAVFRHQGLIYEGEDQYLAGTVPFLWAALEADEPVLVAVGRRQRRLLEEELGGDARWLHCVAIEEVSRNPAAIIPLWRNFVDENGGGPARGISEPAYAGRSPAALEECFRHESLLNLVFAEKPAFSLLCPYDAAALPPRLVARVAGSHRHLLCEGRAEASPRFDPVPDCFAGELPPPASDPDSLSFGLTELAQVRARVAVAAERAGLDPRAVADLVTAASELAANSVMHGGGSGLLRLWRENGTLLTEVSDRGRIEEPLVGRLRPPITQEGGRGLWLANQLCDLVQIRSGEEGTVVRLHVPAPDRPPGFEPPAPATDPRAEGASSKA
jgi:anti-sigma regulatory factor (Ser/Thr protein kinase)